MEKIMGDKLLEALCEIIKENNANENQDFKDKIYQFNELDLFLSSGVEVKKLINYAKYKTDGLIRTSNYTNFDFEKALDIELVNDYLQELSYYLVDVEIQTKYEYSIDGEVIIPTKYQQDFIKYYLKSNNVPVNELTYNLALRRLIVGGDIKSKFDKNYLVDKATELMQKDNEVKNEDIAEA